MGSTAACRFDGNWIWYRIVGCMEPNNGLCSFLCLCTIRETQLNNLVQQRGTKGYPGTKWGLQHLHPTYFCILLINLLWNHRRRHNGKLCRSFQSMLDDLYSSDILNKHLTKEKSQLSGAPNRKCLFECIVIVSFFSQANFVPKNIVLLIMICAELLIAPLRLC